VTLLVAGLVSLTNASPSHGALAVLAILAGQLSIGWSNDSIDAERDRVVARSDKPVAVGAVSARLTMTAAVLSVLVALVLAGPLGWEVSAVVLLGIVCGWTYNLGLKSTPFSWAPFALAFGTLPAVATLASRDARWPAAWAVAAGAMLGAAAHVTNVLPDLLEDAATGIRGLPHRIGASASAVLAPALLSVGSALILVVPSGPGLAARVVGLTTTIAVALWAAAAARRHPGSRRYFLAVIVIAGLDIAFFALSGSALD
jgi:4-hydroxybenzoate polyprenyltransferase